MGKTKKLLAIYVTWILSLSPASANDEKDCRTKLDELPAIIEKTDQFIISKVGKDYFSKNYKANTNVRGFSDKNGACAYFVDYNYLPVEQITKNPNPTITIALTSVAQNALQGDVAIIRDGKIIEPNSKTTKDSAIQKAYDILKSKWKHETPLPTLQFLIDKQYTVTADLLMIPNFDRPGFRWAWRVFFTLTDVGSKKCTETHEFMLTDDELTEVNLTRAPTEYVTCFQ